MCSQFSLRADSGQGLCQGRWGAGRTPDAGHGQPPGGRGPSSADGGPRGAGLALGVQAPWPPPPAQCPLPALCSWLWPGTIRHLVEPQCRVTRLPAHSGLRGRGTGSPQGGSGGCPDPPSLAHGLHDGPFQELLNVPDEFGLLGKKTPTPGESLRTWGLLNPKEEQFGVSLRRVWGEAQWNWAMLVALLVDSQPLWWKWGRA